MLEKVTHGAPAYSVGILKMSFCTEYRPLAYGRLDTRDTPVRVPPQLYQKWISPRGGEAEKDLQPVRPLWLSRPSPPWVSSENCGSRGPRATRCPGVKDRCPQPDIPAYISPLILLSSPPVRFGLHSCGFFPTDWLCCHPSTHSIAKMSLSSALSLPLRRVPVARTLPCAGRLSGYTLRTFSTSVRRDATWGFIGLGRNGYVIYGSLTTYYSGSVVCACETRQQRNETNHVLTCAHLHSGYGSSDTSSYRIQHG